MTEPIANLHTLGWRSARSIGQTIISNQTTHREITMGHLGLTSRRIFLTFLATATASNAAIAGSQSSPDAELLRLGQRFQELASVMDDAIARTRHGHGDYDQLLTKTVEMMCPVEDQIIAWRATTLEGFLVKAKVVAWSNCDDLNPDNVESLPLKVGLSLVRDIIAVGYMNSGATI